MWLVAGLLLGASGLAFLTSFHTQLHGHIATVILGAIAGGWLLSMAIDGHSSSLLWLLFGMDISLSIGTGTLAYRGFISPAAISSTTTTHLAGAIGVALTTLSPSGTVRVNGESWSAESLSGVIPQGAQIQVCAMRGIRLEVLSLAAEALPAGLFELDAEQELPAVESNTEEESL